MQSDLKGVDVAERWDGLKLWENSTLGERFLGQGKDGGLGMWGADYAVISLHQNLGNEERKDSHLVRVKFKRRNRTSGKAEKKKRQWGVARCCHHQANRAMMRCRVGRRRACLILRGERAERSGDVGEVMSSRRQVTGVKGPAAQKTNRLISRINQAEKGSW